MDDVLHTCKTGDMVILGEGEHIISGAGELETGGTIKGIYNTRDTILHPKEFSSVSTLLDFSDNFTEVHISQL